MCVLNLKQIWNPGQIFDQVKKLYKKKEKNVSQFKEKIRKLQNTPKIQIYKNRKKIDKRINITLMKYRLKQTS